MIVQCKNCGTKFNFDETVIKGEGIWSRCSQCKNVFFLDNPIKEESASSTDMKKITEVGSFVHGGALRQDVKEPIDNIKKPEPEFFEEMKKDIDDIDKYKLNSFKKMKGAEVHDEGVIKEGVTKKQGPSRGKQLIYLFIILLLGGIYLMFFSEISGQLLFEKLLGTGQKSEEVGPAQVDLTNIRQRLINNIVIGSIRVIEGTAINQSSLSMTRIKVKAEITDAYTVVLGVRESYCGNLLTNDELATMTDEHIQRELSNPQGSDVSNDRIGPKGQIPFMIVFTREPLGVVKAFVTPVGAERLLP